MLAESDKKSGWAAVRAAFPHTLPVLTGYLFMGMAFGMLLASYGYNPLWALLMAVTIYAGSGQFVGAALMAAGFAPVTALATILMVNARHVFYGVSMLEKFKPFGRAKFYMIFSLTDETFALLTAAKPPEEVREKSFFLAIAILDHMYWIAGCTLGGILGNALPINTTGIDFVMTALFVVIFLEQFRQKPNRVPALIGMGVSLLCRILFGPDWFIMAAMLVLTVVFAAGCKPIERRVSGT